MSTEHNFLRGRRAEADLNRGPSAYQPKALPLGQTGSQFSLLSLCSHRLERRQWVATCSECGCTGLNPRLPERSRLGPVQTAFRKELVAALTDVAWEQRLCRYDVGHERCQSIIHKTVDHPEQMLIQRQRDDRDRHCRTQGGGLSLIHISEPTRQS